MSKIAFQKAILERNNAVDYVRTIAVLSIFLDHYCLTLSSPAFGYIGRFLGGTFNVVFLLISAFLFGRRWRCNDNEPISFFPFILRRLLKLACTLWPFMIGIFVCFLLVGQHFSTKDVLLNLLFLNWFDKLPGCEHLWFITMISFAYILFAVLSRRKIIRSIRNELFLFWVPFSIFAVAIEYILDKRGLPGYILLYFVLLAVIYRFGHEILKIVSKISSTKLFLTIIIVNLITIASLFNNSYELHRTYSYVLLSINGLLLFLGLMRVFEGSRTNKIVYTFSSFGFEVYLVHHPLTTGCLSVYHLTNSPLMAFVLIVLFTGVISIPLHFLSMKLQKMVL